MTTRRKCLVAVGALLLLCAVLAEDIAARVWADDPACTRAAAWALANKGALPTTLDGIGAFPVGYRKYIFKYLTPEQQSALYREQLTTAMKRSSWSAEQRALLQEAWTTWSPEWYREERTPERSLLIRAFEQKIKAAFSGADRELFFQLGPTAPRVTSQSASVVFAERIRGMFVVKASASAFSPEGICSCRYTTDCDDGLICNDPGCDEGPCAAGGGETCTYHCDFPPPL